MGDSFDMIFKREEIEGCNQRVMPMFDTILANFKENQ